MPIPATILVVDDQAYVRHTLGSLLAQQRNWSIYEASDGRAALDRARKLKPDVVVMDIVMPKMDGIAAAYELRQFAPETKVVLISSHYTPHEAAALARLFGNGSFVEKSAAAKDLVPAVSRMLSPEKQACVDIEPHPRVRTMPEDPRLEYPWQQPVFDAFTELRPEYLPAKMSAAERAIAERLRDRTPKDLDEQIALRDALRSLQRLFPQQAKQEPGEKKGIT